jgi:hypothetical protein
MIFFASIPYISKFMKTWAKLFLGSNTVSFWAVLKVGRSYLWTKVTSQLKFHSDGVRLAIFKGLTPAEQ